MIDFTGQTYRNILQRMLDRVPDEYDKSENYFMQTALGPAAYALEEFYLALDLVQNSAYVQTAVGQSLDYLAIIGGIERYPASPAVRLGVFNCPVPIGARFSTINGENSINFTVTAPVSANYQYQLTAETPGVIGNAYTGPILPITLVDGLNSAEITDILVPGDDTETDETFRARLITALNDRPFGGNIADYRRNIMAIDGVGAVQIYPTWNGGGTVKCSVLGADWLPAGETLVNNVQMAIDPPPNQSFGLGLAPIGAKVSIVAPTALTVNITANVTLEDGYTPEQIQPLVSTAVEEYLLTVRKNWAVPLSTIKVEYGANVYVARVLAAIVGTTGVINATDVEINGAAEDLILTETGITQEVPVLGTVIIREA